MNVHFIFPKWTKLLEDHPELARDLPARAIGTFRMASLGIPTAAAALPSGVDVTLCDEHLTSVDYDVRPDLVAIGFFTPQAANANRIADAFRSRGVPTIAGGIHPTMAPDDALAHFDAIVEGDVEGLWEGILADLRGGGMARRYAQTTRTSFGETRPRRSMYDASRYLRTGVVQVARGCSRRCQYCIVPGGYGGTVRRRDVAAVIDDVMTLPYSSYYMADESFLFDDEADRAHATAILEALQAARPNKVFYVGAYPWMIRDIDPGFVKLLRRGGCRQVYLVLGLAGPLRKELADPALRQAIVALHDAGIEVMGSFLLGHDADDGSVGDTVVEFLGATRMLLGEIAINTPWPGTPEFQAMKRAGRLLHEDWSRYNCANVVFQPRNTTVEALERLFEDLWRTMYKGVDPREMSRRYAKAFGKGILDSEV